MIQVMLQLQLSSGTRPHGDHVNLSAEPLLQPGWPRIASVTTLTRTLTIGRCRRALVHTYIPKKVNLGVGQHLRNATTGPRERPPRDFSVSCHSRQRSEASDRPQHPSRPLSTFKSSSSTWVFVALQGADQHKDTCHM